MNVLTLPETDAGIARVKFQIERIDHAAPEASGRQGGVQAGWPLWRAMYELDRMDGPSGDLWDAFLDRLRGRIRTFLGGDVTRQYPRQHRRGFAGMVKAGGGAFDGAANSWAQAIDSDGQALMALTGLPAGLQLSIGDFIGFKWDAPGLPAGNLQRRAMARVSVAAAASGAGAISVIAEPPMDTRVVPAGAIAHLDKPQCMLRLVPSETKIGAVGTGGAVEGGNVVAMQDLRP